MSTIGLLGSVFSRNWFYQPVILLWSDEAMLRSWTAVEIALAQAQSSCGLIPPSAAESIAGTLQDMTFDMGRLGRDIETTMHPFVPVLRQLEERCGEPAASYLHWGATTQNIVDTGMSLQMKRSHGLLLDQLEKASASLEALAGLHRDTPQAGRTHGQHALPITFGFKVAAWHGELRRHRERIEAAASEAFVASMGGAVGTFAAMEGQGRAIQARVAEMLGLTPNDLPARSVYDRQAAYIAALAGVGCAVEKIAGEVFTLQRTEIGEVGEAFYRGKVGSSTMAQKRNPGLAMNLSGLGRLLRARLPLVLEAVVRHDEGDGTANNICEVTVPEAICCAVSLVEGLARLVDGLQIDEAAMRRNLALSGGAIVSEAVMMALARHIGRHHAHHVLYESAQDAADGQGSLADTIRRHRLVQPHLDKLDIAALLDPTRYLGEAVHCVDDEIRRRGDDSISKRRSDDATRSIG